VDSAVFCGLLKTSNALNGGLRRIQAQAKVIVVVPGI